MEPLFTALFSADVLQQVFPFPVYLTLIPVVAGVAFASFDKVSRISTPMYRTPDSVTVCCGIKVCDHAVR